MMIVDRGVTGGASRRMAVDDLAIEYLDMKEALVKCGFAGEIDWQESLDISELSEPGFLREAAWVILCSGFRERIIRRLFADVEDAFFSWKDARTIWDKREVCERRALRVFNNQRKIGGIIEVSRRVAEIGFDAIKAAIAEQGTSYLQEFPMIGQVTSQHLAKNFGMPVVKGDRHLVRYAKQKGFCDVEELCRAISARLDESMAVIDIVLWRYLSLVGAGLDVRSGADKYWAEVMDVK